MLGKYYVKLLGFYRIYKLQEFLKLWGLLKAWKILTESGLHINYYKFNFVSFLDIFNALCTTVAHLKQEDVMYVLD